MFAGAPESELVAFDEPLLLSVWLGLGLAVGLDVSVGGVAVGDVDGLADALGPVPARFEQVGFGEACDRRCGAELLDGAACDGLAEPTGAFPLVCGVGAPGEELGESPFSRPMVVTVCLSWDTP